MLVKQPIRTLLPILISVLLLSGCGFQLRGGVSLPASLSPVHIQGIGQQDALHRELTQLIRYGDLETTDHRQQAGSVLLISHRSSDRRVLSVDGNGKVAEYELHEGVRFTLLDGKGRTLVESQPVDTLTTYLNSETEVLGKQQEEQQLRDDIRRDLAAQIMRRLQAQM